MKIRTTAISALILVVLSGCSADPVAMSQARGLGTLLVYVPHIFSEGIQAYEVAQATGSEFSRIEPPAGKSLIYIYREKQFKGSGLIFPVSVDGVTITHLQNGGYAMAIVEPGMHEVIYPERLIPVLATNSDPYRAIPKKTVISTDKDETVYLATSLKKDWDDSFIDIFLVSAEEALPKISKTRLAVMPSPGKPLRDYPLANSK